MCVEAGVPGENTRDRHTLSLTCEQPQSNTEIELGLQRREASALSTAVHLLGHSLRFILDIEQSCIF